MCIDPEPMLEPLRGWASDRKLRLFACACCRRVWNALTNESGRYAIEVVERFVDGLASNEEVEAASTAAKPASPTPLMDIWLMPPVYAAIGEATLAAARAADLAAARTACIDYPWEVCKGLFEGVRAGERRWQAALLRDIIGNPFRPSALDRSWQCWNGGQVPRIAQAVYDERRFADLPMLGGILEEAGCTENEVLAHCREPSTHARGCWVIDLLLNKS